ncbi:sigma 54-interacting transcriptional regulator [Pectinatus sottacetonis]|uniref:sigma 54-interacting transcriptional regulator n=1 Tax=Pectinatus sottacetonis TaxID=1002795 RepID=UPI0018C57B9B|nr:sigma 54-interacting transcriptional regulator [Pectinatus sottacetonis]
MKNEIQKLIMQEDHNSPYKDMDLAKHFSISREYITILRRELQIPDSRERKQKYILSEIQEILKIRPEIALKELKISLRSKNYTISDYLLGKYLQIIDRQHASKKMLLSKEDEKQKKDIRRGSCAFENLIGVHGSLYAQIQQAKAGMLYPPHGLHCLIVGETGVGKSELAESMYKFALESASISTKAPFNIFNCADYADNPQLLITQLFGCVKGAYTGATVDRKGLIEQTDGGILFLDEVHRLSSEGQEMLFQLIDRGHFRRLGETDAIHKANIQLIAATTENIETNLLATFKRRIPMLISLPALSERPLTERLHLIEKFFNNEATRMNVVLHVTLDTMKAYLLYDCMGNIGQLKSDIQVACAKSFLDFVMHKDEIVHVDVSNLPLHVKKGLLKLSGRRKQIDSLIWKDGWFEPGAETTESKILTEDIYSFPKEFYIYIEQLYDNYEKHGITSEKINKLIGAEIEKKLQNIIAHSQRRMAPLTLDEVAKVIGRDVINLSQEILQIAEKELGEFDQSLVYCLAVHLNAAFTRLGQGKKIINPNLVAIKEKFSCEYAAACKMALAIEYRYKIELPDDEIGYIALYLHKTETEEEGRVGVVVAAHGSVASALLDVASKLLNVTHGKSFNMSFEQDPTDACEDLQKIVYEADEGKGVLLLVDMGSLLTFGEIIQARTKIHVETICRVDTMMVIEALRRSILPEATLGNLVETIEGMLETFPKLPVEKSEQFKKEKAIITTCFTGEGAAVYCSQRLRKIFGKKISNISLLHMGVIGENNIDQQFADIIKKYEILVIIGSVNPRVKNVPYISLRELMTQEGLDHLSRIINTPLINIPTFLQLKKEKIPKIIKSMKFLILQEENTKNKVIHKMCEYLVKTGYVELNYEQAVLNREKLGPFLVNNKVALPHADSSYVKSPVILFAKLAKPINWGNKQSTTLVCMLGLDIDGKDSVQYLYKKFLDKKIIQQLEKAKTEKELREVLIGNANYNK